MISISSRLKIKSIKVANIYLCAKSRKTCKNTMVLINLELTFYFYGNSVTQKYNFLYPIVTKQLVTIAYALYLNYPWAQIKCVYKATQMCDQCDNITS